MRRIRMILLFAICLLTLTVLSSCGCEHQAVVDEAVVATCTEHGLTEGSHCILCGKVLIEQQETELKAHKEKTIKAVNATCETEGLTEGKSCSVCGTVLIEQETVPAMGHTSMTVPASEATCTSPAYSEGTKCSVCDKMLSGHEELAPAKGHTEEKISGYAATCDTDGKTDGTKCSVCGDVVKAQTTIRKKGHSTDTGKCSACGEYIGSTWFSTFYVDEFGDFTDVGVVSNWPLFVGTFSNSATNAADLYVKVLIDEEDVCFMVYEYRSDDHEINTWRTNYYNVTVKTEDGTKYKMEAVFYEDSDRIYLTDKYYNKFIDLLSGSGTLSVYLKNQKYSYDTYTFSIETSNFAVEFDKIS